MKKFIVASALLAFAGVAVSAADDPFPRRFKPNQFQQVVDLIETNMQPGGEHEATADEQARVRTLLGEIGGVLEGNERMADLDQNEQDAIEKRRAEINSILDKPEHHLADQKATSGRKHRKAHEMLDARPGTPSEF